MNVKVYSMPRGGIVFEDPFVPRKFETAFLPVLSVIPLIQHTGNKAYPIVFIGEYVKEGMLIGRGQGAGSANVHATVPGKVVRMASWKTIDGVANEALVVRLEGSFEKLGKRETPNTWEDLSSSDIQRIIAEYGIVEMDDGGRPLADLFAELSRFSDSITLVVRCVFDDPWLAADIVLCDRRLKDIVEGAFITARVCKASRIVYAVSKNDKKLAARFIAAISRHPLSQKTPVDLVVVGNKYPQRNRRELELSLRSYEKNEKKEKLGYLFIAGPATIAAIFDAVKFRKPILDRYVAVGGSAVKEPKVLKVRIGTRLRDVFDQCGGLVNIPERIVIGSPLAGRAILDIDEPIVKTSYAVAALKKEQVGGTAERSCIDCGECRSVCPMGLDPEELFKRCKTDGALAVCGCHGCGCCEAVCPSRIPLKTIIYGAQTNQGAG
ncbi:MAG: SLBB domain-containing protein [Treponema sp.]|jgi:electron transport complex protein RnfC|nr:SLBB domain-containing protein [Treponema sp.]